MAVESQSPNHWRNFHHLSDFYLKSWLFWIFSIFKQLNLTQKDKVPLITVLFKRRLYNSLSVYSTSTSCFYILEPLFHCGPTLWPHEHFSQMFLSLPWLGFLLIQSLCFTLSLFPLDVRSTKVQGGEGSNILSPPTAAIITPMPFSKISSSEAHTPSNLGYP